MYSLDHIFPVLVLPFYVGCFEGTWYHATLETCWLESLFQGTVGWGNGGNLAPGPLKFIANLNITVTPGIPWGLLSACHVPYLFLYLSFPCFTYLVLFKRLFGLLIHIKGSSITDIDAWERKTEREKNSFRQREHLGNHRTKNINHLNWIFLPLIC